MTRSEAISPLTHAYTSLTAKDRLVPLRVARVWHDIRQTLVPASHGTMHIGLGEVRAPKSDRSELYCEHFPDLFPSLVGPDKCISG